jgi:hypothetical protein
LYRSFHAAGTQQQQVETRARRTMLRRQDEFEMAFATRPLCDRDGRRSTARRLWERALQLLFSLWEPRVD